MRAARHARIAAPPVTRSQFLTAAEAVLKSAGIPLSPEDLTRRAISEGLLKSRGKTPWQTMKSKLSIDVLERGAQSRFMRTTKGQFGLREWEADGYREYQAERYRKALLEEDVVVFPTQSLAQVLPGRGLFSNSDMTLLTSASFPMKRRDAELDTGVVQLVSVFLVRHLGRLLTYKRTKRLPEQRLHGSYSLFFGGHVAPDDFGVLFGALHSGSSATFLERELLEELRFPGGMPKLMYRGLLYDDTREVSRQHVGIVFDAQLESPEYEIGERGFLIDAKFETLDEISARKNDFENWSTFLLEYEVKARSECQQA